MGYRDTSRLKRLVSSWHVYRINYHITRGLTVCVNLQIIPDICMCLTQIVRFGWSCQSVFCFKNVIMTEVLFWQLPLQPKFRQNHDIHFSMYVTAHLLPSLFIHISISSCLISQIQYYWKLNDTFKNIAKHLIVYPDVLFFLVLRKHGDEERLVRQTNSTWVKSLVWQWLCSAGCAASSSRTRSACKIS